MIGPFDRHFSSRFRAISPKLEHIIEVHLPGDFSDWDEEHTTWKGEVKTIDGTGNDPRTMSCVLKIFTYYCAPDEHLGYSDKRSNLAALKDFEDGLRASVDALEKLDLPTRYTLSKASSQRYRDSIEPPPNEGILPPDLGLLLHVQALEVGVAEARRYLNDEGQQNRSNRKAAAVARACQVVYEARTREKAPRFARDDPQKKETDGNTQRPLFDQFCEDIFKILDINIRVDSALRTLRAFSNSG